jgi:hypothetical protein
VSLAATTLADRWDRDTGNKAKIAMVGGGNYLLGMIGHGSALTGADKDIAAMAKGAKWATRARFYSLPAYLNTDVLPPITSDVAAVDRLDGQLDGRWLGHEIERDASPALAPWVTRTVTSLIDRSGFGADSVSDLLYMNYKSTDLAGHRYNMINREVRDVLTSVDTSIGELVSFLDDEVGPERYLLVVTADHGQTPEAAATGAWAISIGTLVEAIAENFGVTEKELVQDQRPGHLWLNPQTMKTLDITPEAVAEFLLDYRIKDNIPAGRDVPDQYEDRLDEPVLAAAWSDKQMGDVWRCVQES